MLRMRIARKPMTSPSRRQQPARGIDTMKGMPSRFEQPGRIRADAEERDMRERELAGLADQQVHAEREHDEHHQEVPQVEQILRQQQRQHEAGAAAAQRESGGGVPYFILS